MPDNEAITIITPVFNDWVAFEALVQDINVSLSQASVNVSIIAMDDGSLEQLPTHSQLNKDYKCIKRIEILHLTRNMGHQRAIAIGLSYVENLQQAQTIIVMDADGEDRPQDLLALLTEQRKSNTIVFVQRGKRQESKSFIAFYMAYRTLFWLLTGRHISFGNFCAIPKHLLRRVTFLPEIWNHFAAGIMRSGLPSTTLLLPRGTRYLGKSKMNFVALVMHGLSAISVYADVLAVRMLLLTLGIMLVIVLAGAILLYVRYFTSLAIPGWATTVGLGLSMILIQSFILLLSSAFIILNARSGHFFIPIKDYEDFLLDIEVIYEHS